MHHSAKDKHTLLTSARNVVQVYLCPVLSVGRYVHTHGHAVFSAVLTQDPERWTGLTRVSKQCVLGNQTPTNTEVNKLYHRFSLILKKFLGNAYKMLPYITYGLFFIIILYYHYLFTFIYLTFIFYQLRALHRNLATHAY